MTGRPAARDGGADRPLVVLVAPDSFKGSLTSVEVARALAAGWHRARPADALLLAPLADGGEGTLVAIEAAGGWEWRIAAAHDPLGRETEARWLVAGDGARAVVELAAALGSVAPRRPGSATRSHASTYGTGEVLRAVLDAGIRQIDLGVGGSATTDGGLGILAALGLGMTVEPDLAVHLEDLDPRLGGGGPADRLGRDEPAPGPDRRGRRLRAAEGGQRRSTSGTWTTPSHAGPTRWRRRPGRRERETPGAGAAGGTVFGLACLRDRFRSFAIVPGVDLVMEADRLRREAGRRRPRPHRRGPDRRPDGVRQDGPRAWPGGPAAAGVPCIAVGGGVEPEGIAALAAVGRRGRSRRGAPADGRGGDGRRRRARWSAAASAWRAWSGCWDAGRHARVR